MKILMLNPPYLPKFSRSSRSPAVTKSGTIYYPLWLSYATGVLERSGNEVKLIDAPAAGLTRQEVLDIARDFSPLLIVVDTSTPSIENDVALASAIKTILPNSFIVLVGTHPSALPGEVLALDESINAVARREYDFTLNELSNVLERGGLLSQVKGLSYRQDGKIIHNPDRPYIENLDEIPFVSSVYKKHLDVKNYFYAHCQNPVISFFGGRGCFGQCTFCVYPQTFFGRRYRHRSAENIAEEFAYIAREFPEVREILVDDDNFTADQAHTIKTCAEIVKRGNILPWTCEVRGDISYETLSTMKKAGCRLVVVGFESGSQKILDNVAKGVTLTRYRQFVKDAKRAGLLIHGCFMAGNPGETPATLEETLNFAKSIDMDTVQFFPLMVYPGTEVYEWAKKHNYIRAKNFSQWLDENGLHNCVINTSDLSSTDLVNFCNRARREYYLRPRYLFKKLIRFLISSGERRRTLMALKIFYSYLVK